MPAKVRNLIDVLYKAHKDNAVLYYYSTRDKNKLGTLIMPVTPFIFEFFIYNALYEIDWQKSMEIEEVTYYPESETETKKQRKFAKFLRKYSERNPNLLYRAFARIKDMSLEGEWTQVVPDSRITSQHGESFFRKLREIRNALNEQGKNEAEQKEKFNFSNFFKSIQKCQYFIYLVRNNIFHGSKGIGETYERKQKKCIEVYLTFLRCLTSLFFSVIFHKAI